MKRWRYGWQTGNGALLRNAGSMLSSMIVTSTLGLAYWALAQRLFALEAYAFAGPSVQAMTLLGNAAMLGLGTLLINELPRNRSTPAALIAMALVVAGIAGGVLGGLFAVLAPLGAPRLQPLAGSVLSVALFAGGVSLTAITLVLDQALLGLFRGSDQLWRNTVFAVTKLVVLVALAVSLPGDWLAIYASWMVGNGVSLLVLAAAGARRHHGHTLPRFRMDWTLVRHFRQAAWGHHWLNLALQVPGFALPIVASALLSPVLSAYFFTASLLAGMVFFAPFAIATALYADGSHTPDAFGQRMRFTLKLSLVLGVAANVVLFAGADWVLQLFGKAFAGEAGWTLRLLGLGVFPIIIKDHYVTICRLQGRLGGTALLAIAGSVLELVSAAIGASVGGVLGLTVGWLAALYLEGLVLAPPVYRAAAGAAKSNPSHTHEIDAMRASGTPL